jgi:type II secretory ATPase GspE/PulE/Tfp pilus assembly ATPase PilB-like protein
MEKLIAKNASNHKLEELALKEGLTPLIVSGLEKVKAGLTTMEELMKVTKE